MKPKQDSSGLPFTAFGRERRLCYRGDVDAQGEWMNGVLRTEDGEESYPVEDGIPRFVGSDVSDWDNPEFVEKAFLKGRDPQFYFENAYDYMVHQWPEHDAYLDWLQQIAATDGVILELAVGPGGGAAMMVLDLNPNAQYVMNELSMWLLRQWQTFARRMNRWPNLRFAQFDATKMPIASGGAAAVVSMGGISNIGKSVEEGKHGRHLALQEAFRVLRPGGWLYAVEVIPDHEITDRCPSEMVAKLREMFPEMEEGFQTLMEGIGFAPVRICSMGKRPLVPGEGGLADFCRKHEVVMELQFLQIRARKPE